MRRFRIHLYALLLWSIVFAPLVLAAWWALLAAAPCEILGHGIAISPEGQRSARVSTRVCRVGPFMETAIDRVEVLGPGGAEQIVFEEEAGVGRLEAVWETERSLVLHRVSRAGEPVWSRAVAVPF